MSMMQKFPLDLELKWIRNAFYKMDDQMKIKVELEKARLKKMPSTEPSASFNLTGQRPWSMCLLTNGRLSQQNHGPIKMLLFKPTCIAKKKKKKKKKLLD